MSSSKKIISLLLELRNPFRMFKNRIHKPLHFFITNVLDRYKKRTHDSVLSLKDVLLKAGIFGLIASVVVWIAVFMYIVFYYTYMPNVMHSRPVHFQFKSCNEEKGICSYPTAHIRLTKRHQFFMVGQPYRFILSVDMPNSESNKNLGMFMCCAELRTRSGELTGSSCRSGLMPYQSLLLTVMKTFFFSPLLLPGLKDERSSVNLELFSNFEDDQNSPVTEVYIEIQTRHIQMYSATLNIEAHFSGIRYLMYNWPILSAAFGVSTNLLFIAILCALSWYHLITPMDEENTELSTEEITKEFGSGTSSLFDDDELEGEIEIKKEPIEDIKIKKEALETPTKKDLSIAK